MAISTFEKLDTTELTKQKYLQDGPMTQQFLDDPALDEKMARAKTDNEKVKILYAYIHKNTRNAIFASKSYKSEKKFQRTAGEIWKDGKMAGCTDYALVFATLARKYGLPTTIFNTLEEGCLNNIQENKPITSVNGHAFCECLVDGEWKLLDPTFKVTEKSYNPEHIKLTGLHFVKFKKHFIPISRVIDTGFKQSVIEHNKGLRDMILAESSEKPEITRVPPEHIAKEGYYDSSENILQIHQTSKEQPSPSKEIEQINEVPQP